MVTQDQVKQLNYQFVRIFALPTSRMTFKEVQNALTTTFTGKQEEPNALMTSLLNGELHSSLETGNSADLKKFITEFSTNVRIAKEVSELGEFLNIFSCDFLQQGNQLYFVNRMRRIDGEEYFFLSQPETNIRLARMFINRLNDLKKNVNGVQFDQRLKDELQKTKKDIENLLG